jgi:hypothetical protein
MKDSNHVTGLVIDAAIRVHQELGPGLLESAYEACLAFEIAQSGLYVERQVAVPLTYRAPTATGDTPADDDPDAAGKLQHCYSIAFLLDGSCIWHGNPRL